MERINITISDMRWLNRRPDVLSIGFLWDTVHAEAGRRPNAEEEKQYHLFVSLRNLSVKVAQ